VSRPQLASILWILVVAWGWVIFFASSIPSNELSGSKLLAWDKLNHFIAFAAGGWLAASALRVGQPGGSRRLQVFAAVVIISVYGALDELHQLYTPGRSGADFYDWIADFLGAIAGAIMAVFTHGPLNRFVTRN
jgi:VanZ family protein